MQEYEQSVFISYAWGGESEEIVNQIDQALQQRGLKIIRDKRDLEYKGSISAFMERIGQGNCAIVIISNKYLRSPNCMFELMEIAEGKQFHDRVFPIVLSDANIYDPVRRLEYVKHWEMKRGELAQAMKEVDPANLQGLREDMDLYDRIRDKVSGLTSILKDMNTLTPDLHRDSDFSEIYAGIERRTAEASGRLKSETGESPYMGLRYFDVRDAALFYGRETLTHELLERVQEESLLAIVGASGSGKSSVARAGLIPAWKKANIQGVVHVITPTVHPVESLAASLTRESESVTATSTLMDDFMRDARSLRLYVKKTWGETHLLLLVDQFEETFTLCKDSVERKAFIENLLSLIEDNSRTQLVITLRADFYHHCAEYEGLRVALEKHQAYIGAMTSDELRQAITAPAGSNGWNFQPGLVDLILQDVGTEPGALPLLSHALLETWTRKQGHTLTLQGYADAGGVKKAIAQTAENVYDKLSLTEQTIARIIFLRLTELGEGTQDTRRRVKLDELVQAKEEQETATRVLRMLTDARLVITEQDSAEVAHEALIREWVTLRQWLDENRESLRLHRYLTENAQEWERSGRNEVYLIHRSGRLDDALALEENSIFELSATEQAYLSACVALQNKARRERERRLRYTVTASIAAATIFLLLGGFGLVKSSEATNQAGTAQANAVTATIALAQAKIQENAASTAQAKAEEQANIAFARQLAAQSQSLNLESSSLMIQSGLLAIESASRGAEFQADQALRRYLALAGLPIAHMQHKAAVVSVAFSPDSHEVVSADSAGTVIVWDAQSGKEISHVTRDSPATCVAFSSNGSFIVSGYEDGTTLLWEAQTGREVFSKSSIGDSEKVTSVAIDPSSQYFASASGKIIYVWNIQDGEVIWRLQHLSTVNAFSFSPNGEKIASGSGQLDMYMLNPDASDATVRIWDVKTGREIVQLHHRDVVHSVAFSPNGQYVVSGSGNDWFRPGSYRDFTSRVWDIQSGREVASTTHNGIVYSVAFSPDGAYVVSGADTVKVWNAHSGEEIATMENSNRSHSVAFSPDGVRVISGSNDKTARVWVSQVGYEIVRINFEDQVTSVAFSHDGEYVVSGSKDGSALVWKAQRGSEVVRMRNGESVELHALSPDGKYIAIRDHFTARIYDWRTGLEISNMLHNDFVHDIALSADGKYVVSGSGEIIYNGGLYYYNNGDYSVRVWELKSGKEVARMRHDETVNSVAFSPDGRYVASGSDDNTTRLWDAQTGIEILRINQNNWVTFVSFSSNGQYIISGVNDGAIVISDVKSGTEVARMAHDKGQLDAIALSSDGKYIVSGNEDDGIRAWEIKSGIEISHMTPSNKVVTLAFSQDGKYLASGGEVTGGRSAVQIWNVQNGEEVIQLIHDGNVNSVAFSSDGNYLVSASDDCAIRVWNLRNGKEVAQMTHDETVTNAIFSIDDKYIISTSVDMTVRVWYWQISDLVAEACKRLPRNFTPEEWGQYFEDEIYHATCSNLSIEPESTPMP